MDALLNAATANLLSPMVLAFALGLGAGLARSDLTIPEAIGKGISIYLMFAIGLKGGAAVAESTATLTMGLTVLAGLALSFLMPFVAFALLRVLTNLDATNRAAVAAHYGSISVVTFVTATAFLTSIGLRYEGYLVAVMALMETPAIITGLYLAQRAHAAKTAAASLSAAASTPKPDVRKPSRRGLSRETMREIFLNGSVVLLVGAFFIGLLSGKSGFETVAPFFEAPFKGVLCLFLLDMGLLAAARLRGVKVLTPGLVAAGILMPLIGAALGLGLGAVIGLSVGGTLLLGVLAASASYIAVPAAMRLALPRANPAVYITLSLAVTFPFNVVVGIPLYFAVAQLLVP